MKKLLCAVAALVLMLALAGCGGEPETGKPDNGGAAAPEGSTEGYVFETGDLTVAADALMAPILEKLGEPLQYFEAASCAFNGLDKNYIYAHFEIDTYPAADGDRVMAVYLQDDLIVTKEGLRIGDSKEEMERLYGTGYTVNGNECIYEKGGMSLKILVENGAVSYITFASQVLGKAQQ